MFGRMALPTWPRPHPENLSICHLAKETSQPSSRRREMILDYPSGPDLITKQRSLSPPGIRVYGRR